MISGGIGTAASSQAGRSHGARIQRLLQALLLALALIVLWPAWARAAEGTGPGGMPLHELTQARLVWRGQALPITLPHALPRGQLSADGDRVSFEMELTLEVAPVDPVGLFIAKMSRSGRVTVNGHDLGGCAPGPLEALRCAQFPVYLQSPPSLWTTGSNRITVEIYGNNMQTNGLSSVFVGPAALVHDTLYRPAQFWRQDLVMALHWAIFVFGVISLGIGLSQRGPHRSRHRAIYLWFGLACLLRGISNSYAMVVSVWADAFWTQWVFTASRLSSVPVMLLALLAFFERRLPRVEKALALYALALPGLAALTGARTDIALLLSLPAVAVAIFLLVVIVRWVWQSRTTGDVLLLSAVGLLLVCGFHDIWVLGTASGFVRTMALPAANGILLVTMGGVLLGRVAQALVTAGSLNETLQEKVAASEAGLRRHHQTILTLERRNARMAEREQLMRDLHDGLGSNLASARILLEDRSLAPEQMRHLLDDCIDDMRLLLDSSSAQAQLADALGNLRYRIDQRLQAAPIQVTWEFGLADLPPMRAQPRLQLLRLLQEALTNALRHSGASKIRVVARYEAATRRVRLAVHDDGQGMPAETGAGRGLANMRHRAAQIGATLALHSEPGGGTRVEVEWRLPEESSVAA